MIKRKPTDRCRYQLAAVMACTMLGLATGSFGQPATGSPPPSSDAGKPVSRPVDLAESAISEDLVQTRLKELQASTGLTESEQKMLKEMLGQALEAISSEKEYSAKAAGYVRAAEEAPAVLLGLKDAASQPTSKPVVDVTTGMSLAEMEATLKQFQSQQAVLEKLSIESTAELKTRMSRYGELPNAIASTQERLKRANDELSKAPAAEMNQQAKEVRRLLLLARARALQAEIDAYQKQMATFDTRGSVLRAQKDAADRQLAATQELVKAWEKTVAQSREAEAARQLAAAREAEKHAAGQHPLLLELRKKNTELAEMRTGSGGLNEKQTQVAEQLRQVKDRLAKIEKSSERVRSMVEEVGATQAIGLLLRQQRQTLPDSSDQQKRSVTIRKEMSDTRMRVFELNEVAAELSDLDSRARELLATAAPPVPQHRRLEIQAAISKALHDRKELLRPLLEGYESYFTALAETDTLGKHLLSRGEAFREYIDERILWIRSTTALDVTVLADSGGALMWLASPGSWAAMLAGLRQDAVSVANVLVVLGITALLLLRRRLRRAMATIGHTSGDKSSMSVPRTLWALVLTVTLAATCPLALAFVGWRVAGVPMETEFARAIGHGLLLAAAVWFPMSLLLQLCHHGGAGETYFRWPAAAVRRLGRSLVWLAAVGVPTVFLFGAIDAQDGVVFRNSLGRLALIFLLLLLAVYVLWTFRPNGQFLKAMFGRKKSGLLFRYRRCWHPVACLVPLSLAVASMAGYHYTAIQLSSRLLIQVWLLVGLVLLNAVMTNWLLAARKRLARRVLARRREMAGQAVSLDEGSIASSPQETQSEDVDLVAVSAQTGRFVRYLMGALLVASVWVIWSEVLTGLGILRQVKLWNVTVEGQPVAVTAANLAIALLVVWITVLAYRNVPGILEVTILQRLQLESGGRYAIGHLARYAVAVVGVVWALGEIGVRWGHIQWLVAAMTVGLGFGLQEIFANFVSGLIILFEQPIRVGDTVTVGDTTGAVSRIRIRATTITDWDRKELIVPNKEFVTSRLVNWSLSDKVIRAILKVGIAYGSDTDLAEKILRDVAQANPTVLDDPKPVVLFKGFGESSLDFELRVYVSGIENYRPVWHDLTKAIDCEFRKAKIEIAFPQRDIHIRSTVAQSPARAESPEPPSFLNASDPPEDILG